MRGDSYKGDGSLHLTRLTRKGWEKPSKHGQGTSDSTEPLIPAIESKVVKGKNIK